jgi:hypothetical protein
VTLRVVGGDEKGSLESETVKYGHESYGTRTRKLLRWRGPTAIVNDRSVLSSERAPQIKKNSQLSDNSKDMDVSPRWVLYSKTDWPADLLGRNIKLNRSKRRNLDVIIARSYELL